MAYYYSILDDYSKQLYDLIFDGINKLEKKIYMPPTARNIAFSAFNSVLYDNPILFYTRAFRYSNTHLLGLQSVLSPVYKYKEELINQSADVISDYLRLFDIVKEKSDLEKELFVHDHCLDNFKYDHDFHEHAFSALGPVMYDTGVCEGISKFVKLALNYLGVDCIVVAGDAIRPGDNSRNTEKHMWNIVYINGVTYNLDVTFDLTQKSSVNRYDFFNLPDSQIKNSHKSAGLAPVCNTEGHDYYTLNRQIVKGFSGAEKYIENELLAGNNNIVFKLQGGRNDSSDTDKIISIAHGQHQKLINRSGSVNVRPNLKQGVFEVEFLT